MKKILLIVSAAVLMSACGAQKNSTSSTGTQQTSSQQATTAMSFGQGAGDALYNLYRQFKADGNKYDIQNMQNVLNTVSLIANCQGLKTNYKDKQYLSDFGKGMIAGSLGLVTRNNVEQVTNSLVDMVKNSDEYQDTKTKAQSTASTAAGYANTAAQYAGALSALLGAFSAQE